MFLLFICNIQKIRSNVNCYLSKKNFEEKSMLKKITILHFLPIIAYEFPGIRIFDKDDFLTRAYHLNNIKIFSFEPEKKMKGGARFLAFSATVK